MQPRHSPTSILLLVAILAIAVIVSSSHAARPAPAQGVISSALVKLGGAGDLQPLESGCQVGVTDDPHITMMYLYPPDDEYYTLLDPATCDCGEQVGFTPTVAHVTLDFSEACSIPVTVSVVAADLSNPLCPTPMREQYLCPSVDYDLTVSEAGLYNMSIPLHPGCCITQAAFLMISFRAVGDCGGVPGLAMAFACNPCVSWNYWSGGALVDLCDGYLLGNPNMYVDATCCQSVPLLPDTWERVKSMYR